ncbi:flagellar transcriptional regulator FlhD [Paraburkholderia sp. J8-2]|uniref:flagellar transcriptional regulator FlhD n=1 Tax=Paraburkholderia sp. J8-2 TaxID=2805440 RepID=UPI002AB668F0|nr:flagellar transcriptional regulator FlhD [Paraburkholderia sp. J8-2]
MLTAQSDLSAIYEVNLRFLLLIQNLLREDIDAAVEQFGMTSEMAAVMGNLSEVQVDQLARSSFLLCRFRFNDVQILSALGEKGVSSRILTRSETLVSR